MCLEQGYMYHKAMINDKKDSFFSIDLPLTHPDVLVTKKWESNHLANALEITRRH